MYIGNLNTDQVLYLNGPKPLVQIYEQIVWNKKTHETKSNSSDNLNTISISSHSKLYRFGHFEYQTSLVLRSPLYVSYPFFGYLSYLSIFLTGF